MAQASQVTLAADGKTIILEEELDQNYEPTQKEIYQYAEYLGLDPEQDKDLFYIAKQGLKAPIPPNWKLCKSPQKQVYYFNFQTGESIWDHPCDQYYKKLIQQEKQKKRMNKFKKKSTRKYKSSVEGSH